MLHHENNIEEDRYVPQSKLDRIPQDAGPIALQIRIDNQLGNGQNTAYNIQQYLPNAPTDSRLPLIIRPHLWHVFHKRYHQLDIPNSGNLLSIQPTCRHPYQQQIEWPTHHINPGPALRIPSTIPPLHQNYCYHTPHCNHTPKNQTPNPCPYQYSKPLLLKPPQPAPKLAQSHRTNKQRMYRECDIVLAYGIGGAIVAGLVLGADQRRGVEGCGRYGVAGEAEDVQEGKGGRGAGGGAAGEIEVGLGVEGKGPGEGAVACC